MYKKLVTISLFIFFAVVTATLTAGLVFYQNKQVDGGSSSRNQPAAPASDTTKSYTLDEVARHNQKSDCWQVIEEKVYDITAYFGKHPGGDKTLLKFCGKEATEAFKGLPHSEKAWGLLPPMQIGVLGGSPAKSTEATSKTYTLSDVSTHSQKTDCWQVIDGKIYDITAYFGKHPGGDGKLLKFCGKDASEAFKGLPHSDFAWSLLPPYLIGDLK